MIMSICPFCSLHCDDINPAEGEYLGCSAAKKGFAVTATRVARVGKKTVTYDRAVAAAVRLLRRAGAVLVDAEAADITCQRQALILAKKLGRFVVGPNQSLVEGHSHTASLGEAASRADLVVLLGDGIPNSVIKKLFSAPPSFGGKRRLLRLKNEEAELQILNIAAADNKMIPPLKAIKKARYAVFVMATPTSKPLLIPAVHRLLEAVNRDGGRAALLPFNPETGAAGTRMVATALGEIGRPTGENFAACLRVDLLGLHPPPKSLPKPLALVGRKDDPAAEVFIPSSIPGIDGRGMFMRADSVSIAVCRPYKSVGPRGLKSAAATLATINAAVPKGREQWGKTAWK